MPMAATCASLRRWRSAASRWDVRSARSCKGSKSWWPRPAALLDLRASNGLKLGQVEFLVLDEADRMLDMGFINEHPKDRVQIADQAADAVLLGDDAKGYRRARRSDAARSGARGRDTGRLDVERITQRIIQVDHSAKPAVLAQLMKQEQVSRALIFTRTKHGADKVVKGLARAGITADAIHGNKSQNQSRTGAWRHSVPAKIRTLVATDIAARGIDVEWHQPCGEFRSSQRARKPMSIASAARRAPARTASPSRFCAGEEMAFSARYRKAGSASHCPGKTAARRVIATPHRRQRSIEAPGPDRACTRPRGNEAAPGSKGPRRHRRPGGNGNVPPTNRHEANRQEAVAPVVARRRQG